MNRIAPAITLIALIAVLYINYLSGTGKIYDISAGGVSGLYPTLFTPDGFTFSIWSVIYLFNIGFVVYQIFKMIKKPSESDTQLQLGYLIVCLFNILWIFAWHALNFELTLIFMFGLLFSLIFCYLKSGGLKDGAGSFLLERTTFSLYLAWISVATIANVSIFAVSKGVSAYGTVASSHTIVMLGVAGILAIFFLLIKKDILFQFVIIWAFYGIYSARYIESYDGSQKVAMAAVIGIIVISLVFLASRFLKITTQKTSS